MLPPHLRAGDIPAEHRADQHRLGVRRTDTEFLVHLGDERSDPLVRNVARFTIPIRLLDAIGGTASAYSINGAETGNLHSALSACQI